MKVGNFCFASHSAPLLNMLYKITSLIVFSLLLFSTTLQNTYAADIKTSLDRNRVNINESFQITFTANQSPDSSPDFSPLEKNFEIISQNQQNKSSWINGTSSQSIQWILNVMAKRTGNLTIPVISFGSDSSDPETILITANPNAEVNESDDIILKVEASPTTSYVQSQIIYTLKVYRKVQITQARLNEPKIADAILEPLGEDKNYTTEINGMAYAVTERNYAIFPQKSGIITIAPTVLTAEIISNNRSRFNGFFNRQSTKTKRISSNEITLNIKAVPTNFTSKHWIPAKNLSIKEKWSGDINQLKVGEPITRTLTLLANGTTVAQLPEIYNNPEIAQIKTYPDQPVLKEQKTVDGMIALREEKIAFIPSKPGNYTLPAIEIPWFNTQTQTLEKAVIPETFLLAIAPANTQNNTPLASPSPIETVISPGSLDSSSPSQNDNTWMWTAVFLACCLLTSLFFLFKNLYPKQQGDSVLVNPKTIKLATVVKQIKKACELNNKYSTKEALLNWGKIRFNSHNLADIATHCDARLRDEITVLNKSLYAQQPDSWQGKKLFQAFTENNAHEKLMESRSNELEPLYKL